MRYELLDDGPPVDDRPYAVACVFDLSIPISLTPERAIRFHVDRVNYLGAGTGYPMERDSTTHGIRDGFQVHQTEPLLVETEDGQWFVCSRTALRGYLLRTGQDAPEGLVLS